MKDELAWDAAITVGYRLYRKMALSTSNSLQHAVGHFQVYARTYCVMYPSCLRGVCKKGTVIELECYKRLYPFHAVSTPSSSSHLWLNGQRDFVFLCLVCVWVRACVCACMCVVCICACMCACV